MSVLAFDLGGSAVKYGLYTDGVLHDKGQFKTPLLWTDMIASMRSVFDASQGISGIALSVPGVVDEGSGTVRGTSAIEYIHQFDIIASLRDVFQVPISMQNDAHCAALAELHSGCAQGMSDLLFVVVGTGIGGVMIQSGEIVSGKNSFAGEFGCMILDGHTSFSLLGTAVHMAERYCLRNNEAKDARDGCEVFRRAEMGEALALEETSLFYDYLALGIYNLLFTSDPECIVIGGGVSQYEPLLANLETRIQKRLSNAGFHDFKFDLRMAHFHNDANLMGAISNHLKMNEKLES